MPIYFGSELQRSNSDYSIADTDSLRGTWKRVATKASLLTMQSDKIKNGQPVYIDDADGNGNPGVYILTDKNNYTNASYTGWTELQLGGNGIAWNDVTGKPNLYTEAQVDNLLSNKADSSTVTSHTSNTSNPHQVSLEQARFENNELAGDIDANNNTITGLKTPNSSTDAARKAETDQIQNNLTSHTNNTSNPHNVTKVQLNLGNVPNLNTTDAVNKAHDQNTDTGTSNGSFQIDSGVTGNRIKSSTDEIEVRNSADDAYVDFRSKKIFATEREITPLTNQSGDISISVTDKQEIGMSVTANITELIFTDGYVGQRFNVIIGKDAAYYAIEFAQPYDSSTGSSIGDYVFYDNKVYKCTTTQNSGAINLSNYQLYIKFESDFVYVPSYGIDKKDQLVVTILSQAGNNYYLVSVKHDV